MQASRRVLATLKVSGEHGMRERGSVCADFWFQNSKTHANLKAAFAGESQANRRYLYFAQKADVEVS